MENILDGVIAKINDYMDQGGTYSSLERASGVPRATLRTIRNRMNNPSIDNIQLLLDFFESKR